jgi:hypothetical protein
MSVLITEQVFNVKYLTETNKAGEKEQFIEGIFMQAEKQNKNGRVYPAELVGREAQRYNANYVNQNRAFGELGHPDSPQINLDKVSHLITKLYPDGNNWIGKAKILETPNGNIVKNLLKGGASLGVSCRGVGSLKESGKGYQVVQDDYHLATAADIVADPSAPDAFVQGIMEGKEWLFDNNGWKEVDYDKAKRQIQAASRADYEVKALSLFENYLSKL